MTRKQKIHSHFLQLINEKIKSLQQVLADLKDSGTNETKSTAGDKHETALAMLQIEQANVRKQLEETVSQKAALEKINPANAAPVILNGSLVKTSRGYFFISIAMAKAIIDEDSIIGISPASPLGLQLIGLKAGGATIINGNQYIVESIE